MVKFNTADVGLIIGSTGVLAPSGIITETVPDGVPLGVQFAAVVHELSTLPFQVRIVNSDSSNVNLTAPKTLAKIFPTFASLRQYILLTKIVVSTN